MGWTEERVSTLKNLWAEGLSASQIAKQLGGVTRNAVIGKVHRLGLAGRVTQSRPVKRPVRTARPRSVASPQARPRLPQAQPMPAMPQLEPLRREDGGFTTVLNLTDRTCKWPIGDPAEPNFAFCGRAPCNGGPYCEHHSAVAFQPQSAKKRRGHSENDELRRLLRFAL